MIGKPVVYKDYTGVDRPALVSSEVGTTHVGPVLTLIVYYEHAASWKLEFAVQMNGNLFPTNNTWRFP